MRLGFDMDQRYAANSRMSAVCVWISVCGGKRGVVCEGGGGEIGEGGGVVRREGAKGSIPYTFNT
jgi:hypothetical protein